MMYNAYVELNGHRLYAGECERSAGHLTFSITRGDAGKFDSHEMRDIEWFINEELGLDTGRDRL
jgi:hypothetical protein